MNAKTEVNHTPTPWNIRPFKSPMRHPDGEFAGHQTDYLIGVPRNDGLSYEKHLADTSKEICIVRGNEADAAFIVRAVNAHEELVKAAKTLEDELSQIQFSMRDSLTKAITKFRAVIAKAEARP